MKFEIKQEGEEGEKVARLFLEQCSVTGDIDLRADSADGDIKGELIMAFREGKFENYSIDDKEAEALGIDRDDDEYMVEETS